MKSAGPFHSHLKSAGLLHSYMKSAGLLHSHMKIAGLLHSHMKSAGLFYSHLNFQGLDLVWEESMFLELLVQKSKDVVIWSFIAFTASIVSTHFLCDLFIFHFCLLSGLPCSIRNTSNNTAKQLKK